MTRLVASPRLLGWNGLFRIRVHSWRRRVSAFSRSSARKNSVAPWVFGCAERGACPLSTRSPRPRPSRGDAKNVTKRPPDTRRPGLSDRVSWHDFPAKAERGDSNPRYPLRGTKVRLRVARPAGDDVREYDHPRLEDGRRHRLDSPRSPLAAPPRRHGGRALSPSGTWAGICAMRLETALVLSFRGQIVPALHFG